MRDRTGVDPVDAPVGTSDDGVEPLRPVAAGTGMRPLTGQTVPRVHLAPGPWRGVVDRYFERLGDGT